MDGGGIDVLFRRVDADDGGAEARHGFAQKTTATADIKEAQALEGFAVKGIAGEAGADLFLDIVETHRVEDMQNAKLALEIPPFGSQFREFLYLSRV